MKRLFLLFAVAVTLSVLSVFAGSANAATIATACVNGAGQPINCHVNIYQYHDGYFALVHSADFNGVHSWNSPWSSGPTQYVSHNGVTKQCGQWSCYVTFYN